MKYDPEYLKVSGFTQKCSQKWFLQDQDKSKVFCHESKSLWCETWSSLKSLVMRQVKSQVSK